MAWLATRLLSARRSGAPWRSPTARRVATESSSLACLVALGGLLKVTLASKAAVSKKFTGTGCLNWRPRRRSTNCTMSVTRGSHAEADAPVDGNLDAAGADDRFSWERTAAAATPVTKRAATHTVAKISRAPNRGPATEGATAGGRGSGGTGAAGFRGTLLRTTGLGTAGSRAIGSGSGRCLRQP